MKRILAILLLVCTSARLHVCAQTDDFGTWVEVGAEKTLPRNLSVGVEGELRTRDISTKVDRLSVGGSLGYKVNKYLKVGVTYNFMESYKDSKTSKEEYDTEGTLLSYRYTSTYWKPRHRLSVEVSPSIKAWKLVKFSLRERYQYTHQKELTVPRYDYELYDGVWEREPSTKGDKTIDASDTHILRSRFKAELNKKRLAWSPFVSIEAQNYLNQSMKLKRVRTALGTGYKINKRQEISAAYVFTCDTDDNCDRRHAINIGYDIKF